MSKKNLMGSIIPYLLKEFTPNIPEDKQHEVENDVVNKMKSILGENWFTLPVSGPYMMVAVLVMNYVLLPQGITPTVVADTVLTKSKEYGLDQKFNDLLFSAKATAGTTGEFTSDKLKELSEYSDQKSKELSLHLKELIGEGQKLGKNIFKNSSNLGKGLISNIKHRINGDDEPDNNNSSETE